MDVSYTYCEMGKYGYVTLVREEEGKPFQKKREWGVKINTNNVWKSHKESYFGYQKLHTIYIAIHVCVPGTLF